MAEETITILKVDTSDAVTSIKDLRDNITKLKEQISKIDIGTDQYKKTLTDLITNQNALRNAMNATTASMSDVAKAAKGVSNANIGMADTYNGLVAQMANMRREIRNVNVSTEEGMAEFRKQAEEIAKVNAKLKEMDALTGNYQRNVGNYKSAFNGLNNAMAQVVREAPAAAISMNTFFLAISNNIPILADQIAMLNEQNKQAIARGEKGVSVISALIKSLMSWNTVLTAVIVVFTMFGDKILSFIGDLFKKKEAVDVNAEAMKRYKDAVNEARKAEAEAVVTSRLLYDIATDETRSMEDRLSAVRQLQDEYPDYLGNMSEEAILAGNAKDAYDRLTESLIENARAKAYLNRITELQGEILDETLKKEEAEKKRTDAQTALDRANLDLSFARASSSGATGTGTISAASNISVLESAVSQAEQRVSDLNEEIQGYNDRILSLNKTIDSLSKDIPVDYITDDVNQNTGSKQSADNTLDLLRQAEDARIALMEEGMVKDLELNRVHYERQIEDLKIQLETEENLTETGREAIKDTIVSLTEKQEQEKLRIITEYNQKELQEYQKLEDQIRKDEERAIKDSIKEEERQNRATEKSNASKLEGVDKYTQNRLAENRSTIKQPWWKEQENEYKIIQEGNQKKLELLNQFAQDALEAGNLDGYLEYQQQASDLSVEIQQNENDRKKQLYEQDKNAKVQTLQAVASATSSVLNSVADMYEANAGDSEKAANEIKNIRIAAATIDTISGAIGAYTQAAATIPPPAGIIVGAVQAAAVIAAGLAQIAQIRNTKVDKDSAPGSGVSANVSAPTLTPQVSTVKNLTSASEEDRLNRMAGDQRVYILQSDIEAADNRKKVQVEESTF